MALASRMQAEPRITMHSVVTLAGLEDRDLDNVNKINP